MTLSRSKAFSLTTLLLLVAPAVASAHVGYADSGFAAGVGHPFNGVDHVLAMVAVGLWAAQTGGQARWLLPVAFVAAMVVGGAAQWAGVHVPQVEAGIAASVLLLGLVIATGLRLPVWAAATVAGVFAIFHGAAHATEFGGGSVGAYAIGFVLATMLLHAVGAGLGLLASRSRATTVVRTAGGAIAACGVLIVAGVM